MARGAGRARALVACAAGALAGFIVLGAADAQTNRSLTQVERDRRAESARAERLRREAADARREAAELDARLVEAGRRRADAESAATDAEARLGALQRQIAAETVRQRQARDALESALIAAAFSQRRVELRAVRNGTLAAALAPGFAAAERSSTHSLAQARDLEPQIAAERQALAEALAAVETERAQVATLLERRRAAQARLTADAAAADRRARQLSAEARSLRELAQRVQPARRSGGSAPGAAVVPATWRTPTDGRVVRAFGARDGQGGPAAQGVTLQTRSSAQIVAPAAAEVAYAGAFRSYGNVLILNLDGGYALVLTGMETIGARVGETVRAGQPVGEMPASDTTAPELYVEVRRDGRPIDPGRWLVSRGQSADRGVRAG